MAGAVAGGVFGGDDHLISVAAFLHPVADPLLGLFGLVVVGSGRSVSIVIVGQNSRGIGDSLRVNKIAAVLVEEIEDAFSLLAVAFAHEIFPCVPKVHSSQAQGGDSNTGIRSQHAVYTQWALWLWGRLEERHCRYLFLCFFTQSQLGEKLVKFKMFE